MTGYYWMKNLLKMAIVHSYVKLQEGICGICFLFWGWDVLLICLVENTVGCSISVLKFCCCCEKCGREMWVNSIYSIRIQFLGGWQQELETPAAIQGNAGNKARDDLFKKIRKMNENDDKLSIQKFAATGMGSKPCDVAVSAMYVWPWCQTLCLQKGSGMCHDENVHIKLYKLYKDAIWFMLLCDETGWKWNDIEKEWM